MDGVAGQAESVKLFDERFAFHFFIGEEDGLREAFISRAIFYAGQSRVFIKILLIFICIKIPLLIKTFIIFINFTSPQILNQIIEMIIFLIIRGKDEILFNPFIEQKTVFCRRDRTWGAWTETIAFQLSHMKW